MLRTLERHLPCAIAPLRHEEPKKQQGEKDEKATIVGDPVIERESEDLEDKNVTLLLRGYDEVFALDQDRMAQ